MLMFWSVHTLYHQHNHFLGIPNERESVCVRKREKGNQKDVVCTVSVTRPLV